MFAVKSTGWRSLASAAVLALFILVLSQSFPDAAEGPAFKWGFSERVRQTYISNAFDLSSGNDDDWSFFRVRSQLWCSYHPLEGVKLYAGLNNEHRHWMKSTRGYEDDDFEIDELIFENLYLSADRIGGSPVSIIAGRQNIMYGEGFLFMDGGPIDGSRTAYFNALRVKVTGEKRWVEAHLIMDPQRDDYLPVANSLRRDLVEYDERGAGIYYFDETQKDLRIEAYYVFKNEKDEDGIFPESDIHTAGGRLSGKLAERVSFAAEFAFQSGKRGSDERRAYGGYAHSTLTGPGSMRPRLTAGLIYLSGDDPESERHEGWDPLYSRWPKWSELYIYTQAAHERGVAYWDNLFSPNVRASADLIENITLEASLYWMFAPERDAGSLPFTADKDPIYGAGNNRGMLSIVKLKWKAKKYLSAHMLWERFAPGDFYNEEAEAADFLRWEIYFRY